MRAAILTTALLLPACGSMNAPTVDQESHWPIVYKQKFLSQRTLADFAFTDAVRWEWHQQGDQHGLKLLGGSQYKPTHRSPTSIALIKSVEVLDFDLDVDLMQTGRNYGHRDMCVFFGFQSPSRFYYTHMATKPDANAHNIFRVKDAPRTNMAPVAKNGIDWGDATWNHVHIERRVKDGSIHVYWNDQEEPILSATDTSFDWGRIGFGSFDDSGIVANIVLRAPLTRSVNGMVNPFAKSAR